MTLKTKIKQLNPTWGSDKLQIWDDSLLRRVSSFVTDLYVSESESVNVYAIIGTDNKDYLGKSWSDVVKTEFILDSHIESYQLKNELLYKPIIDLTLGPVVYLISLDGIKWYVEGNGITDIALARYDLIAADQYTIHNVHKRDFRVDWTMFRYYTTLEGLIKMHKLPFSLHAQNVLKTQTTYAGYTHKINEIQVTLDRADGRVQNLSRIEAELMIAELSKTNTAKTTLLNKIMGRT